MTVTIHLWPKQSQKCHDMLWNSQNCPRVLDNAYACSQWQTIPNTKSLQNTKTYAMIQSFLQTRISSGPLCSYVCWTVDSDVLDSTLQNSGYQILSDFANCIPDPDCVLVSTVKFCVMQYALINMLMSVLTVYIIWVLNMTDFARRLMWFIRSNMHSFWCDVPDTVCVRTIAEGVCVTQLWRKLLINNCLKFVFWPLFDRVFLRFLPAICCRIL